MKTVYIYGAGVAGRDVFNRIKNTHDVKGFLDSDSSKWGGRIGNISIIGGANLVSELVYDEIIVASLTGTEEIRDMLLKEDVPMNKINTSSVLVPIEARLNFLRDYANLYKEYSTDYAVAEGGVFQGDFAKEINASFPESTIYLFDTFKGFDAQDAYADKEKGVSNAEPGYFSNTSESLVMSRLPHPEKAIIKKGYFPKTAKGLEDIRFFFVNLDFDLYQPILEGLRFFYPRIVKRGVILVHDYFNPNYMGVSQAICDFEKEADS